MHPIVINDIPLDPATAEFVAIHPGGDRRFVREDCRRFDECLFKTPQGWWFIISPLAPDEVRARMTAHGDEVLLEQTFPAEEREGWPGQGNERLLSG